MNFYEYVNFGLKSMTNRAAKRGDIERVAKLLDSHFDRLNNRLAKREQDVDNSDFPGIAAAIYNKEVLGHLHNDSKLLSRLAKKMDK